MSDCPAYFRSEVPVGADQLKVYVDRELTAERDCSGSTVARSVEI